MRISKVVSRPVLAMSAALLAPALVLLPTPAVFAETSGPKIVGGETAAPGEFPWQVALLNADVEDNAEAQFCGGALIAPNWVVTAAHCVTEGKNAVAASRVDVLGGTSNLKIGGTRVPVDAIIVHSRWSGTSAENDIALLRLAEPLADKVVPLVTREREVALTAAGTLATATGWGETRVEGDSYPVELRKVQVPIVTNRVCNGESAYNGAIKPKMVCAGLAAGGRDACQGDSGGPLVVPNGKKGFALAGIVSWGHGCAEPNKYGVYTRVARFAAWIERVMAKPQKKASLRAPDTALGARP